MIQQLQINQKSSHKSKSRHSGKPLAGIVIDPPANVVYDPGQRHSGTVLTRIYEIASNTRKEILDPS